MTTQFPLQSLVWLKQPDYPWWPSLVIDPAQVEQELPDGADLCLMCLPSTASSLAFTSSANTEEVRPFLGGEKDAAMVAEGRAHPDCAAAVEEALLMYAGATASTEERNETAGADAAEEAEAPSEAHQDSASAIDNEDYWEKPEKKKKDKKKKKDRKREREHEYEDKSSRREKKKKHKVSFDEDSSDSEEDRHRHARRHHDREKHQTHMEDYVDSEEANPQEYYTRKFAEERAYTTNEELQETGNRLLQIVHSEGAPEEKESSLLEALRSLASCDVRLDQLQDTQIGVKVGRLLHGFTQPVWELANAILRYWFTLLPRSVQKDLYESREVDRGSVATTAGERSEDEGPPLGQVGVLIFESFTEEEIYDMPFDINVGAIAKRLEEALAGKDSDSRSLVIAALSNPANTQLRRGLLEGKLTAEDVANHAGDLDDLVRMGRRTTADGMPTPQSPLTPFMPSGPNFSSPTGRGSFGSFTTMYTCPNCGSQEAERSAYSVQAHDNFPDILLCRKCGTRWNLAEA